MSDRIWLNVVSNGCTSAAHFVIEKDPVEHCHYVINRVQLDLCKRASFVAQFEIDRPDTACSPDEVVIENPPLSGS